MFIMLNKYSKNFLAAFFAVIVSVSIIVSTIPAGSCAHSFLAPPALLDIHAFRRSAATEPSESTGSQFTILLADKPGNENTVFAIEKMIEKFFKNEARLLDPSTFGIGSNDSQLRKLIKTQNPTVILIRSDTIAFKNPDFVRFAGEHGVWAIIRMGAGVENVDKEATASAGISLIRTHGNANSVANLTLRFLIASLAQESYPEDYKPDFSEFPLWNKIFDLPLEQFLHALIKSIKKGRGEMLPEQEQRVFSSYSPEQASNILSRLEGKTIGLIGFGAIAQIFARKLNMIREQRNLSFSIIATSPKLDEKDPERVRIAEEIGVEFPGEDQVLKRADILSFHLPAEDEPYFDLDKLAIAEKVRILINTARQKVIDPAVWETFFSRQKSLCFSDVNAAKENVPIEEVKKLLDLYPRQFYNTPHIAASTPDAAAGVEEKTLPSLKATLSLLLGREPDIFPDVVNGIIPSDHRHSTSSILYRARKEIAVSK